MPEFSGGLLGENIPDFDREKFQEAAKPLIEYLASRHDEYTSCVVNYDKATLVRDVEYFNTNEFVFKKNNK